MRAASLGSIARDPSAPPELVLRAALDGVDAVATAMERKWGVGRLRLLVSDDLRARFDLSGTQPGLYTVVAKNGADVVQWYDNFYVDPATPMAVGTDVQAADVLRRTATGMATSAMSNNTTRFTAGNGADGPRASISPIA